MGRKTNTPDPSLCLKLFEHVEGAALLKNSIEDFRVVDPMKTVEVNVVGAQSLQLLGKDAPHLVTAFGRPLGHQDKGVPLNPQFFQSDPIAMFTLSVSMGRLDVIDPL